MTQSDLMVAFEQCVAKALPKPELRHRFYTHYVFAPLKKDAEGREFRSGTEIWASRVGAVLVRELSSVPHFFRTIARNGKADHSEVTSLTTTVRDIQRRYDMLAKKCRAAQKEKLAMLAQQDILDAVHAEGNEPSVAVAEDNLRAEQEYEVPTIDKAPEMREPEIEREPEPEVNEDEAVDELSYFEESSDPFARQGYSYEEAVGAHVE